MPRAARPRRCPRVILDLGALTFIDSTGLRAVVRGLNALRSSGADMAVRSPNAAARKLLRISNLARVLEIQD